MACIVNITLSVKPELRAECLHELSLILPGTKSYSGCNLVYLSENSDTDKIEVISKWDSREAYDTYLGWRQESGFFGGLGEKYVNGEPSWKFMPVLMDFNKLNLAWGRRGGNTLLSLQVLGIFEAQEVGLISLAEQLVRALRVLLVKSGSVLIFD